MPLIVDCVDFLTEKNRLYRDVGPAITSTRSVPWASNMPKIPTSLSTIGALILAPFGAQLLYPQCKILAAPL